MSNPTVAQAINRSNVEQAYTQALREAGTDKQYRDKIIRAYSLLVGTAWAFDGEWLRIQSGTTSTRKYTVGHNTCQCPAYEKNFMCYHRIARRLLIKASELSAQPVISELETSVALLEACGLVQRVAATPTDNAALAALEAYDQYADEPLVPATCDGCNCYLTAGEFNYCWRCVERRVDELF